MWHPRLLTDAHIYPWQMDLFSPRELEALSRELRNRNPDGI